MSLIFRFCCRFSSRDPCRDCKPLRVGASTFEGETGCPGVNGVFCKNFLLFGKLITFSFWLIYCKNILLILRKWPLGHTYRRISKVPKMTIARKSVNNVPVSFSKIRLLSFSKLSHLTLHLRSSSVLPTSERNSRAQRKFNKVLFCISEKSSSLISPTTLGLNLFDSHHTTLNSIAADSAALLVVFCRWAFERTNSLEWNHMAWP